VKFADALPANLGAAMARVRLLDQQCAATVAARPFLVDS
jgi:hypothetical protein